MLQLQAPDSITLNRRRITIALIVHVELYLIRDPSLLNFPIPKSLDFKVETEIYKNKLIISRNLCF